MRVLCLALLAAASALAQERPIVVIETSKGAIKIELLPESAPKTVANFLRYVDSGFYDDTVFHRVIRKFVVQGGGFTPELELKPTFPPTPIETKNGLPNERGTVAMARMDAKDSATSQLFINLANNETLNRSAFSFGYTVFGRVIEGMEVVDAIANVQTSKRGPMDDVPILPVFLDHAYRAPAGGQSAETKR
jgi:cyclophilin family peptidyl-prolyl cis-trans isomerase